MTRIRGIYLFAVFSMLFYSVSNLQAGGKSKPVSKSKADIAPEVTIISPTSPFSTTSEKIDITVHFKAENGNCKIIQLIIGGKVVAT